jgi:hypothetical protein
LPARTASTAASPGPEEMDEVPLGPTESEPDDIVAAVESSATTAKEPLAATVSVPSRVTLIAAPLAACLVLMGIFALLLRGADVRGPEDAS